MTPADVLRAAATKLREMAAKVPAGPWTTERYWWKLRSDAIPDQWMVGINDSNADQVAAVPERFDCDDPGTEHHHLAAEHAAWIALMGPDKGLVLATLLDVCAYSQQVHAGCSGLANAMTPEHESALVFARAVLGEKP